MQISDLAHKSTGAEPSLREESCTSWKIIGTIQTRHLQFRDAVKDWNIYPVDFDQIKDRLNELTKPEINLKDPERLVPPNQPLREQNWPNELRLIKCQKDLSTKGETIP